MKRFRPNWPLSILLVVLALLAVVAIDRSDDSSGLPAETFIWIAAIGLVLVLVGSLTGRRPAKGKLATILGGFGVAVVVSLLIYVAPPEIAGRADFQFRVAVSVALAAAIVYFAKAREGSVFDWLLGVLLGVLAGPALLFGVLVVSCGGGECFS